MNLRSRYLTILLKLIKKFYGLFHNNNKLIKSDFTIPDDYDSSNRIIKELILSDKPFMLARLGATELTCISNYLSIKLKVSVLSFIKGKSFLPWWDFKILQQMKKWSGFYPSTPEMANLFSEMMIKDSLNVDILASHSPMEDFLKNQLISSTKFSFYQIEPFFSTNPWTAALENKNVLVIHPFAEDIKAQYLIKNLVHENNLLPDFNLITFEAVQSLGGSNEFSNWFEALNFMKNNIKKINFDVAIIGCGAYGFPIASFVKDLGKQAIHLGGVTQILFGIKGKRWENDKLQNYQELMNEHWIKPSPNYKPSNSNDVENGCYW